MIGAYDSGHGGLTVFRKLITQFDHLDFIYLGDHAHAPFGDKPSEEIVELTRRGVETLFEKGARLVILACNTATAVACRSLQQDWLPNSKWKDRNILGIIAPTVEAATQTPWAINTPQYPQKYNTDIIGIFGTSCTINSNVYKEEIAKRCPKVTVIQQACPLLAGKIEAGASEDELKELVAKYAKELLDKTDHTPPDKIILGCTHYPLVKELFFKQFPRQTRFLFQAEAVADSFDYYLERHPEYIKPPISKDGQTIILLTSDDPMRHNELNKIFWPEAPLFEKL